MKLKNITDFLDWMPCKHGMTAYFLHTIKNSRLRLILFKKFKKIICVIARWGQLGYKKP